VVGEVPAAERELLKLSCGGRRDSHTQARRHARVEGRERHSTAAAAAATDEHRVHGEAKNGRQVSRSARGAG